MKRFSLLGMTVCATGLLFVSSGFAQIKDITLASQDVANTAKVAYPGTPGLAVPPKKAAAASSDGPDSSRPWEIEFHGGGMFATNPDGGSSALPAPGASFTAGSGGSSRAISSSMFGDGAALFNTVITNGGPVGSTVITPLDPVLNSNIVERKASGGIGMRLSRDITPRCGIYFSTYYSFAPNEITGRALAGVEATRASWVAAHSDNFTNGCGCVNSVGAISDIQRSEGSQLFFTGAVNINLLTERRFIPYITLGGGAVVNTGSNPHAGIFGQYSVLIGGEHAATDQINVRSQMDSVQGTFLAGIGAKYYVTPRWGLRFDFRDHVTPYRVTTRLDASPFLPNIPGSGPVGPGGDPTLQFSNDASLGQDTLSGPQLRGFRTFRSDGVQNLFNVSVGVFFRF